MAMTTGGRGGIKSEINVTPLVDVVLVLLIIFMVVTPMLQRGKSVDLPKSRVVDKDPGTGDPVILSITSDRKLWFDHDEVSEEQLLKKLEDEIIANPNRAFLVKGDAKVTVGEVRKLMAIARKAGARGVRIAVEQLKEG
jgi:biopolymer transport protein ExbD/biopolymer transport protein TolR